MNEQTDAEVLDQARAAVRDYANGRPADQVLQELLILLMTPTVAPDDMSGFDRWPVI